MASENFKHINPGINLVPNSTTKVAVVGDLDYSTDTGKFNVLTAEGASPIVTEAGTQTLTNKTLLTSANTITGTVNKAAQFNTSTGALEASSTTNTELGYVHGVTSAIQTQLNAISGASITALTGDVTATGPGSVAASLVATTNSTLTTLSSLSLPGTQVTGNISGNAANVTGTVLITHGGTGQTTKSAGFDALSPMSASGDIIYGGASGTGTRLAKGSDGQVLTLASGVPSWAASSGGISSIGSLDGQTVNAQGAAISGSVLYMQSADATHPGLVNNTAQSFSGTKTFTGSIVTTNILDNGSGVTVQTGGFNDVNIIPGTGAFLYLKSPIGTALKEISTPVIFPAAGYDSLYFKSDGNLYKLNSSGAEAQVGSGSGGINYILNPNAESATTGWATYADAAGNIPVDGTGGTATNLTFSRSTSSPLIGNASFLMAQANSTSLQGKGVSYDFTIDSAFKGQVLTASFNYNASATFIASNGTTPPLNDGTTSTNAGNSDIEVFIYDVTNAVLIPVTPQIMTSNGTNNSIFFGTFQTSSNSTSYRLILHVATTSANATGWSFKFDNVIVGPQAITHGPAISDYKNDQTFTVNNMGTITNSNFSYKREGDSLRVKVYFTQGTASASTASITLPFTIDSTSSKLPASKTSYLGILNNLNSGAPFASPQGIVLFYDGSDTAKIYLSIVESSNSYSKALGNTWSTGDSFSGEFSVPILGWSSNVDFSNDTDTRVVSLSVSGSAPSSSSGNPVIWPTVDFDTHGGYNASTGIYKVPVSGFYEVTVFASDGGSRVLQTYKNGSNYRAILISDSVSGVSVGTDTVKCIAGDTLNISSNSTDTESGHMTIKRLSGPATIAASNSVAAAAYLSADTAFASSQINFDTIEFDDTGSITTGASWKFTAPISGKYQVSVNATATGSNANLILYKNGSAVKYLLTANSTVLVGATALIRLVSGDFIDIRDEATRTLLGPSSGIQQTFISIIRVGNY